MFDVISDPVVGMFCENFFYCSQQTSWPIEEGQQLESKGVSTQVTVVPILKLL